MNRPIIFPRRIHLAVVAFFGVIFAIYGSLIPLNFTPLPFSTAINHFSKLELQGLSQISKSDWVVNVLLFVPIGFFGLGIIGVDRKRWISICSTIPIFGLCGGLSIGIEFSQLWFPPRFPSINDIVAQFIGSLIGLSLWIVSGQIFTDWIRTCFTDIKPKRTIDWLLQAYILGFLICSFMPFDLTVSVADLYRKYERGKILFIPFSYHYTSAFEMLYGYFSDLILFIPVGYFCSTVLRPQEKPLRQVWLSVFFGFLIAIGIEIIQLLVLSRFTNVTDLITGTLGVWAGALIARRLNWGGREGDASISFLLGKTSVIWMCISMAYMIVLLLGLWYPYDFTLDKKIIRESLGNFFQFPFSSLYQGSYYKAIEQVIRKPLLFLPLGIFLAQSILNLSVPQGIKYIFLVVIACLSLIFGAGIELGQVVMPSHVADTTDVILYSFGSLFGMMLSLRIKKSIQAHTAETQTEKSIT